MKINSAQIPKVSLTTEGRVEGWESFWTWLRCNHRPTIEIITKLENLKGERERDMFPICQLLVYEYLMEIVQLQESMVTYMRANPSECASCL